jgi:hypothetical protein
VSGYLSKRLMCCIPLSSAARVVFGCTVPGPVACHALPAAQLALHVLLAQFALPLPWLDSSYLLLTGTVLSRDVDQYCLPGST